MKKIFAIGAAALLAAGVSMAGTAPSMAAHWVHHNNFGPGPGIAAGILGFAAGAAIAGAAADRNRGYDYNDHVDACMDAYRSYDVRSDSYLGYDGYRHRCEL